MDLNNQIIEFPVELFGNLTPYSETISKTRVRIFYRGANRNGSWITDEFALSLIASVPYAPIKGIYSTQDQDYEGHGAERNEGRIYGVVAAEPNFAWEKHLDSDGVEREYACVDGLIYTALYEEAKSIPGKSQSMEIYRPSIKGDWKEIDGKTYFVYTAGCFLGLQVLGDKKEPCFEGAGFFTLFNSLQQIKDQIDDEHLGRELEEIGQRIQEYELKKLQQSGGKPMPQLDIYKLSHSDTERKLFEMLNPPVEEGQEVESYTCLCQVYDKYAIVVVYTKESCDPRFERVYYTKNDETDTIEITSREVCYMMDVTEQEKRILNSLYEQNDNSYEAVAASYEKLQSDCEKFSQDLSTKNEECEQLKLTFNVEKENMTSEYEAKIASLATEKDAEIATLTAERDGLAQFKLDVETARKMDIVHSYEDKLPSDIIDKYTKDVVNFSEEQLDMYLTYELKKHNPNAFSTQTTVLIPKDKPLSGLEAILAPYRDRK